MKPNKGRTYAGICAVAAVMVAIALALVGLSSWTYFGVIGFLLGLATLSAPPRV